MTLVRFVFGRRIQQDLPGYPSGPCHPFYFTIETDHAPVSWHSAHAILSFFRDRFVDACRGANTSSALNVIANTDMWIPTPNLDRPTIEVIDGAGVRELLVDGDPPNPWLSLTQAA